MCCDEECRNSSALVQAIWNFFFAKSLCPTIMLGSVGLFRVSCSVCAVVNWEMLLMTSAQEGKFDGLLRHVFALAADELHCTLSGSTRHLRTMSGILNETVVPFQKRE